MQLKKPFEYVGISMKRRNNVKLNNRELQELLKGLEKLGGNIENWKLQERIIKELENTQKRTENTRINQL